VTDRFGVVRKFTAKTPDALLTPVWAKLPAGVVYVDVDALDAFGKKIGVSGHRCFYRNVPFTNSYPPKVRSYAESARMAYDFMFQSERIQCLRKGTADIHKDPLFRYPSKMFSAIIRSMINYAEMAPEKKNDAMEIACKCAKYMMRKSVPEEGKLEYLPWTYEGDVDAAGKYKGTIMMIYPAEVGSAMIALAKATNKKEYLDYAKKIGDHYLRLQLPNGSWHLVLNIADGSARNENSCNPCVIYPFLEDLSNALKDKKYVKATENGKIYFDDTIRTFNWEGQFEDTCPAQEPYINLSKHTATDIYLYLAGKYPNDPKIIQGAREAQRFSEDQFVVWEQPGWAWHSFQAAPRIPTDEWGWQHWYTPCSLEQYGCFAPVNASLGKMIRYYLLMFTLEGKPIDLAKARALGDSITRFQSSDGRIPTWCDPNLGDDWINCTFASADYMKLLSEYDSVQI